MTYPSSTSSGNARGVSAISLSTAGSVDAKVGAGAGVGVATTSVLLGASQSIGMGERSDKPIDSMKLSIRGMSNLGNGARGSEALCSVLAAAEAQSQGFATAMLRLLGAAAVGGAVRGAGYGADRVLAARRAGWLGRDARRVVAVIWKSDGVAVAPHVRTFGMGTILWWYGGLLSAMIKRV